MRTDRGNGAHLRRTALCVAICCAATLASAQTSPQAEHTRIVQQLKEQPLWFEDNAGGSQPDLRFLSRGSRYALALTRGEALLAVTGPGVRAGSLVHLRLLGAADRDPVGVDLLPGRTYYADGTVGPLKGSRRFRRVRYDAVYPGIDAIYHGDNDRLEFDFVVSPNADPGLIQLALTGADHIELAGGGDLVVRVAAGEVRLKQPIAYQEIDGVRRDVAAAFRLDERSIVGFDLGPFDRSHPLVIDPTISFATYIGSEKPDSIVSLETDASGAVYVSGSVPFDATTLWAPLFSSFGGGGPASPRCYFAKLVPDFNGGLSYDYIAMIRDGFGCGAMAVAPNGDVAVSGPNFVFGGLMRTFSNQSGSLVQNALFPLPIQTFDHVRLDNSGNSYTVGLCAQEMSPGTVWPLPGGPQQHPVPGLCRNPNAFPGTATQEVLVVADASGQITYGTFIGTDATELDVTALDVDALGRAWIAGHTSGGLVYVTPDAFQAQPVGASDAFLAVLDPAGSGLGSLRYATYFGGVGMERDIAMALQPAGQVYLAGNTWTLAGFPGRDFINPAIFLSRLDISQPPANQLVSTAAVIESPLTSLYGNAETTTAMRSLPSGSLALLANSTDPLFPLVQPLYSTPYDPTNPNTVRPVLLVYDPSASTFTLATFLDDVQQARFPRVAADAGGSLFVGMTTSESNRSTDASLPLGQRDVLLLAITGVAAVNLPPTVSILDRLASTTGTTVYADSPAGGTLELLASVADPEGDSLTYFWSGPFTNNPVNTDQFLRATVPVGTHTITVTVDDGHGNIVSASRTFNVVGTPFVGATATPIDSTLNALMVSYAPVTIAATGIGAGSYHAYLRTRLDQLPPVPGNLQAGSPPMYFDVSADAVLIPPIGVCIDTRGMSFARPNGVRLYHLQQAGQLQFWTDVTSPGYPQGNQLCGQSNTLGTFAIFYAQVPSTAVHTIAGNGVLTGSIDGPGGNLADDFVAGPATATSLSYLFGGAFDRSNNRLFFSDGSYILRLDLNTNTVGRVAGNGIGLIGILDGPGGDPRDDLVEGGNAFNTYVGFPRDLVLTPAGDLLFFEANTCRIRRLDLAQSLLFTVAGNGVCAGSSGDGFSAALAAISSGQMVFDAAGNLFIAEHNNGRVRRIDAQTNIIDTVAGDGTFGIPVHGAAARSTVSSPLGIAFDAQGQLLIAGGIHLLRVSTGAADGFVDGDADEVISIVGGCNTNCQVPFNGDGLAMSNPQVFLAGMGRLMVAQDGAIVFADAVRIRRIAPGADGIVTGASDEIISTVGGYYDFASLSSSFNGDTFSTQSLFGPNNVVVEDNQNNLIVLDGSNYRVRRFGLAPSAPNPNAVDLTISAIDSPDPVNAGSTLGYSISVTNNGPAAATAVAVTYVIPAGVVFESAPASCTAPAAGSAGTVSCALGSLASGASATLSIAVRPQAAASLASTFNVSSAEVDSNVANNVTSVTTTVTLAPVVITVDEGIIVTDAVNLLPSALIAISENIVVADAVNVLPSAMIGVVEQITVTDAPAIVPPLIVQISEQIVVNDVPVLLPSAMIGVAETVVVTDTPSITTPNTSPVVNAGADQIVEATSPQGASVTLTGVATDPDGDQLTLTWSGPCGSAAGASVTLNCALGLHIVTFTADDSRGGVVTDTILVTVRDTTPPALTLPGDITTSFSSSGVAVTFSATAADLVSGAVTPSCSPASGSIFPVGVTIVICTATDAAGNQATGSFTVTVPAPPAGSPQLHLPGNLTVLATSPSGAVVTYTATASVSAFGGSFTVAASCAPASGSLFPIGTTTVTCTAVNPFAPPPLSAPAAGSFTVTVIVGVPSLTAVIQQKGRDSNGYFVDLLLNNKGTGHARTVTVASLTFRTLGGSGTVSVDTRFSNPPPYPLGSMDAGTGQSIQIYLVVPPTVTRFAIIVNGTLTNVVGTGSAFSFAQTVIP